MKDHKLAINVGTIGHVDHGRTTLSAALVRLLDQEMIEVAPFEASLEPGVSIPINCYDHEEAASIVICVNNTPKGPRVKRGKGNRYR